jgi:hypothetical protein
MMARGRTAAAAAVSSTTASAKTQRPGATAAPSSNRTARWRGGPGWGSALARAQVGPAIVTSVRARTLSACHGPSPPWVDSRITSPPSSWRCNASSASRRDLPMPSSPVTITAAP